jgi:hypothetical protein
VSSPHGTYRATIGSQQVHLPIVPLAEDLAISLMMTIDLGVAFTATAAAELAGLLRPARPKVVVSVATLGIPVAYGQPRVRPRRLPHRAESPEIHLRDALREPVTSITSSGPQHLLLGRQRVPLIAGRRVAFVDDVISTGASSAARVPSPRPRWRQRRRHRCSPH